MSVRSYRDLRVWHAGMDLVVQTYHITAGFPRHEAFGLTSQMQRAAVSVPSNIAEGHERTHLREYLHHLSMAQGSVAELETQAEIAMRLGYMTEEMFGFLLAQIGSVGRQLRRLRASLTENTASEPSTQDPEPSTHDPY